MAKMAALVYGQRRLIVLYCLWTLCTLICGSAAAEEKKDPLADFTSEKCTYSNNTMPCKDGFQCMFCLRNGPCAEGIGECVPCFMGDYCPNGTANAYGWTKGAVCPRGHICRNSTHKAPCPAGWFCPEGTFYLPKELLCKDNKGLFCGEGSYKNTSACPKGSYCPNSYTSRECPEGYFCKDFSMAPKKCSAGSRCPKGSSAASMSPVSVSAIFVVLLITIVILFYVEKALASRQEEFRKSMDVDILKRSTKKNVLGKLLNIPLASLAEEVDGFEAAARPITIQFDKLKLTMEGKVLLNDVSGTFAAGTLVAVMGPSGCGKSTLLNTLTGKATYGERTGKVLINKVERDLESLQKVVGFVPQDDTVFAQLTVRENLSFSARLRLPKEKAFDRAKWTAIVNGAIQVLGLETQQNAIVGSVEKRGISGGQKKRVNIGVELVADPTLLFLDEPTSGLGATDTLVVMKACRTFASYKRTVVSVIHQPRYSVFTLFHDVMLLGKGGNIVFAGPTRVALSYFEARGFLLPANENPADFFLDTISCLVVHKSGKKVDPEILYEFWSSYESGGFDGQKHKDQAALEAEQSQEKTADGLPKEFTERIKAEWAKVDKDGNGSLDNEEFVAVISELGVTLKKEDVPKLLEIFDEDKSGNIEFHEFMKMAAEQYRILHSSSRLDELDDSATGEDPAVRVTPGMHIQFFIFMDRAWLQWLRDVRVTCIDGFLVVIAGVVVGALLGSNWKYQDVPSNSCMSTVTLGILATVSALRLFGEDRVLYWREKATGVSTLAYFSAKGFVNLVDNCWRSLLFLAIYYNLLLPNIGFGDYFGILFVTCWACAGMGMFISSILPPSAALLLGVIYPLVTGVFLAGVNEPKLKEMGMGLKVICGLSFTRWASEAITVAEMDAEDPYQQERIDMLMDTIGYNQKNKTDCVVALFVMGAVFRILAFIFMTDYVHDFIKGILKRAELAAEVAAEGLGIIDDDEKWDKTSMLGLLGGAVSGAAGTVTGAVSGAAGAVTGVVSGAAEAVSGAAVGMYEGTPAKLGPQSLPLSPTFKGKDPVVEEDDVKVEVK